MISQFLRHVKGESETCRSLVLPGNIGLMPEWILSPSPDRPVETNRNQGNRPDRKGGYGQGKTGKDFRGQESE